MHFHKITGLALALAPLSMAGACPAKPYQKPDVSSPPDVPEVTPVPYQTTTQPADAPVATAPATADAPAPETTTKAKKHTKTKSKHHGHRKTTTGSPAEQTPSAPEQTPSAPEETPSTPEETPSAPKETPAEPKAEPTSSGPPSPPAARNTAAPAPAGPKFVGLGTRYGLDYPCTEADCWQKGSCSFTDYKLPAGIDGTTCVSEEIWDNGAHCGGCISVTYKGKTLTIMVTNRTDGKSTHLDMTPDTWAKLTNGYSGGGVNGIEWEFIECPIETPLSIKLHGGASKYWFAASVEGAKTRTSKLEVSSDEGKTWMNTHREVFNMYILGKVLPSNSAWVRVTSIDGKVVVVKDVELASGKITAAAVNY
ncbi:hypothetical protein E4U60_003180 [Claviceps pazoutovae]|uniref:Expansin-like EG45 domain-containing protein n=1 Tax=Claviceps pazoutovae TaxID=1649127 RepID=A0A9P7SG97_9HYPO|nr:hypothetical protein E4U60_003180 [Claviceps pazoutovae]